MQNSVSAQTSPPQTSPAQAFPSSQPLQRQVLPDHPAVSHLLLGAAQATDQAEILALLHILLQAVDDLQLRVGQLEHTEHIRAALKPRRDLGIDY